MLPQTPPSQHSSLPFCSVLLNLAALTWMVVSWLYRGAGKKFTALLVWKGLDVEQMVENSTISDIYKNRVIIRSSAGKISIIEHNLLGAFNRKNAQNLKREHIFYCMKISLVDIHIVEVNQVSEVQHQYSFCWN